jgi:hypothetical protein
VGTPTFANTTSASTGMFRRFTYWQRHKCLFAICNASLNVRVMRLA